MLAAKEAMACGSTFNVQGMNAIVLYIGGSAKPGSFPMENPYPTFKSPVADSRHLETPKPAMVSTNRGYHSSGFLREAGRCAGF
jgi:hypothetical protein